MATEQGVIEAVSTKFDKFSVLVNGNWYGTKQEWAPNPLPQKGDEIRFEAKGGKYLNKCKIVGSGDVGSKSGAQSRGFSNLGVELGHASNLAMEVMGMLMSRGQLSPEANSDFYKQWIEHTDTIYKSMKALREKYQNETNSASDLEAEREKKAAFSKPKEEEDLF